VRHPMGLNLNPNFSVSLEMHSPINSKFDNGTQTDNRKGVEFRATKGTGVAYHKVWVSRKGPRNPRRTYRRGRTGPVSPDRIRYAR